MADTGNDRVQVFHAANGSHIVTFGGRGAGDGEFKSPASASWSPDGGRIAVADTGNDRVQVFHAANGTLDSKFGMSGAGDGHFSDPRSVSLADAPPSPPDAVQSRPPAGMLAPGMIVVTEEGNDRVQVFYGNGTFAYAFGSEGSANGTFSRPASAVVNPHGSKIAVADMDNHRIQVLHANGTFDFAFGTQGSGDKEFEYPNSVSYSPDGDKIAVADYGNHRIQVFDAATGAFDFEFGSHGYGDQEFRTPRSVAYSPDGSSIAVADAFNHRVQVFRAADGDHIRKIGLGGLGGGTADGYFNIPRSVAWSPDGAKIAVVDRGNNRVQVFHAGNGSHILTFGAPGAGDGNFSKPLVASWSPDGGRIAVADQGNDRIQVFDAATGAFAFKFGSSGIVNGTFDRPISVAFVQDTWMPGTIDPPDGVFAVAELHGYIQVFHPDGSRDYTVGSIAADRSSAAGGVFSRIDHVAYSPSGDKLAAVDYNIANYRYSRIQVFDAATGAFDFAFGYPVWAGKLDYSPDGERIVVADRHNHRINVYSATSGAKIDDFGRFGARAGQMVMPTAAEYSPDGTRIAVSDPHNNRISVFYPNGTHDDAFGMHGRADVSEPRDVAWSPDGDHIAALSREHVKVFHANGTLDYQFGSGYPACFYQFTCPLTGDQLAWPTGISYTPSGDRIFVVDNNSDRVSIFHANGTFDATFGGSDGNYFGERGVLRWPYDIDFVKP